MKSKVHPTYKTKYRVANWPAYNQALVRRGDVTVWLSAEAIAAWTPGRSGRRGGQRRYSDLAIETALTLRLLYHLPLRQAEGFLHALFGMMRLDLEAPDYTTLSRRSQHLRRCLRPVPTDEGVWCNKEAEASLVAGRSAAHGPCREPHPSPVRLEFPILSLNPGLRQRCVVPDVRVPRAAPRRRSRSALHLCPWRGLVGQAASAHCSDTRCR